MNELRVIPFEKAEQLFEVRKTVFHTSNYIYFIGLYTALNSFLSIIGEIRFVGLALNIASFIDEIIDNAPTIMIVIGLLFNSLIIFFFFFLGKKVKKREMWAYKLAMTLYFIDTFIIFILPYQNKISTLILHVFILWLIWLEYREYGNYFKLERDLYLPDWALTKESNVLFIKKEDFDLQSNEATQIKWYKKGLEYDENNKHINAINFYSKAIDIWKNIPIIKNKDKDWFAMSLMNRAILTRSIRSRDYHGIQHDLIHAYFNFKKVLDEDVTPESTNQYTNRINQYSNYGYVSEYFAKCSYHLLSSLMSKLDNNKNILKYAQTTLQIEARETKYLMNEIYLDCFRVFEDFQIDIWNNKWSKKILEEITIPHDNRTFNITLKY